MHRAVLGSFDFAEEMWVVMTCLIHVRGVIQARLDPEFKRNDNPTYEQLSSIAPRSVLESVEVQIIRFSGGALLCSPDAASTGSALRLDVGLPSRARSFRRSATMGSTSLLTRQVHGAHEPARETARYPPCS